MRPFPLLQTCEAVSGHEAGTGVVQGWAESSGVFGWEEGTGLLVGREPLRGRERMAPSRCSPTGGREAGNPVASGGSGLLPAARQSKGRSGGDRKSLPAFFFFFKQTNDAIFSIFILEGQCFGKYQHPWLLETVGSKVKIPAFLPVSPSPPSQHCLVFHPYLAQVVAGLAVLSFTTLAMPMTFLHLRAMSAKSYI